MFNKVILQGRLTRDPEMFATQNGHTICKFTIANNRKVKDRDEVLFIDCTAFNKTGEVCAQYLGKGSTCIVSGKLVTEKWTGKDGQERQKNSVNIEEVEFISRPDNQHSRQPQYSQPQQPAYNPKQQPAHANPAIQSAITQAIVDQQAQQGQQGQQESQEDFIPF